MALDPLAIVEGLGALVTIAGTIAVVKWRVGANEKAIDRQAAIEKQREDTAAAQRREDREHDERQRAEIMRAVEGVGRSVEASRSEQAMFREKLSDELRDIRDSISEGSTALGKLTAEVGFLGRENEANKAEIIRQREAVHALRGELSTARLRAATSPKPTDG
jgi:chromosome segregation ATPase